MVLPTIVTTCMLYEGAGAKWVLVARSCLALFVATKVVAKVFIKLLFLVRAALEVGPGLEWQLGVSMACLPSIVMSRQDGYAPVPQRIQLQVVADCEEKVVVPASAKQVVCLCLAEMVLELAVGGRLGFVREEAYRMGLGLCVGLLMFQATM